MLCDKCETYRNALPARESNYISAGPAGADAAKHAPTGTATELALGTYGWVLICDEIGQAP